MKNKKWIIGILAALCIVFVIGTAVFAAGTAKKVFTRSDRTPVSTEDYITEDEAKKIALDHAELTEGEVTFIQIKLDYDDGTAEYEIEFYKDNMEYDYSIDASTGAIRSFDHEAEGHHKPHDSNSGTGPTQEDNSSCIPESEAVQKALDHAQLAESDVTGLTVKLDYDDGQNKYEVEFWVDRMEYNYEISAVTGEIISYDKEIDD